MPWQHDAAAVALEVDPATGLYARSTVIVTVPRQSGKTELEGVVADHRCLTLPRARAWITMQTGKDAAEWMRNEHASSLAAMGRSTAWALSKRAGSTGIVWRNGSTFTAFAPTRDGLHSKQGDLVYVDEAWAHGAEAGAALRQAIRPTMATRAGSQLWIVSTEGDAASVYLDDYLALGVASVTDPGNDRVAMVGYGVPRGTSADDLDTIAAHHPAHGHTITTATLADARQDFGADTAGYLRAYGNLASVTRLAAWPPDVWEKCGRPRPDRPERFALAFDVTPDGSSVTIVAAWPAPFLTLDADATPFTKTVAALANALDDPERAHVEILTPARTSGRDAIAYLAALTAPTDTPLQWDPTNPAAVDLADALARDKRIDRRYRIDAVTPRDMSGRCVAIGRHVTQQLVHHSRQPALTAAVEHAARVDIADGGWRWSRLHSAGDITGIIAATIALGAIPAIPQPRATRVLTATPR